MYPTKMKIYQNNRKIMAARKLISIQIFSFKIQLFGIFEEAF